MLHSMTGFARQAAESPLGALTCELRAVNHRYLDIQFRLPDELRPKELDFRQQIGAALKRGKVECNIHLRRSSGDASELNLNQDLVRQLAARAADLQKSVPDLAPMRPADFLRWPGVVEEPVIDTEPLFGHAKDLVTETLVALTGMRQSEGKRIAQMLDSRCDEISGLADGVRRRMPEVLAAVRARQQERIDKLDVQADPARLETELALVAQKLDVDEEIDRLESHVVEIRAALSSDDAVGRRLDFLMQELNREANTLGSKSADAATTRAAVDLKVLIEQMREQIQNIE